MRDIRLENIQFKYRESEEFCLNIPDFVIDANSRVFIEGASGSGKTTFLNVVTGLMTPIKGSIHILGTDMTKLTKGAADRFRADHFGIIFQLFNLIPYLSVIENIILPCTFSRIRQYKALQCASSLEQEARRLCTELDIHHELIQKPVSHLSIGQQQRVAIARAVIGSPEIIVADEPTSALDNERKEHFMTTLLAECQKTKATLIFVSHDMTLKPYFEHIYDVNQINKSQQKSTQKSYVIH